MTWAYVDGKFVDASQPAIFADDGGFLWAHGVFETFRARNGRVYRLADHVARLRCGGETLAVPVPDEVDNLPEIVADTCNRNNLEDARVRITLTGGRQGSGPTLVVQARAREHDQALYEKGAAAVIVGWRRNETSPLSRIKSLNYLDNLIARREAQAAGAFDALFLNTRGTLAEGAATNVFLVSGGTLVTPPIDDGALPGVTRLAVLGLAASNGTAADERPMRIEELRDVEEAFLTNAVAGVVPLVRVGGKAVGKGEPGPVTVRMRELYEEPAAAA